MDFSTRLRELRVSHDMLQQELADLLNMKPSAVSKYEKGLTQPSLDTLIRLADIFHVSVDFLVGVSSVENPYEKSQLSPREADVILRFRRLSYENKIRIDERINALLDTQTGRTYTDKS
ncbi:MAG: helix-turn-helix transcriptional regulator [Clostridiales bacterium]|nr:helix-turn-helix transcriptional regulator [Clostridiales bacterium]